MRRALEYARTFGLPLAVHEEDLHLAGKGVMNEGPTATRLGPAGRAGAGRGRHGAARPRAARSSPAAASTSATSRRRGVRALREAKRRGLPVTAEVTPHHLALTDEDVAASDYDPDFKMNPPLRSAADVEALREGLADGTIDAIATDHAPHSPEEKELEFDAALNGVLGLETAFPVCLKLVRRRAPHRAAAHRGAHHRCAARVLRPPGRHARVRCGGRRRGARPRGLLGGRPDARLSKTRNTPFEGGDADREVHPRLRRRQAGAPDGRSSMRKATLALADGTVFEGQAFGAAGRDLRRGRLQHLDDRLPGDPHRPVVRRADRHHDLPGAATTGRTRRRGVGQPHATGFVVRNFACEPSSYRAEEGIEDYLAPRDRGD